MHLTSGPRFLVFGSTGNQGRSVVNHLLASPKPYNILALTRDPSGPAAKELKALGVEVVKADLQDAGSVREAMKGVDYVFGNTTSYRTLGRQGQYEEGKLIVDTVHSSSVKMLFWSGAINISKLSGGKYNEVGFYDGREDVFQYGKDKGVPIISVFPAAFYDNYLTSLKPRKNPEGTFIFSTTLPLDKPIDHVSPLVTTGAYVVSALESGVKSGTELFGVGEALTMNDVVKTWSEVTGQKAEARRIEPEAWEKMAGVGYRQLWDFMSEYGYFGGADLAMSLSLVDESKRQTFKAWCEQQDWSGIIGA